MEVDTLFIHIKEEIGINQITNKEIGIVKPIVISKIRSNNSSCVVLNFSGIDIISTSSMGLLNHFEKVAKNNGKDFFIQNINETIKEQLNFSDISFSIFQK